MTKEDETKAEVTIDVYQFFNAYNKSEFFEKAISNALKSNNSFNETVAKIVYEKITKTETMNKIQTNVHVAVDKFFSKKSLSEDYQFINALNSIVRESVREQKSKIDSLVEQTLQEKGLNETVKKQIQVEITSRVGELFGRYNQD